jgi:hypothetical protein
MANLTFLVLILLGLNITLMYINSNLKNIIFMRILNIALLFTILCSLIKKFSNDNKL